MNQKIIIKRKNGKYTIKGNGDEYLLDLGVGAFRRGEMKPTFRHQLKRFFKRIWWTYLHVVDSAAFNVVGSESAIEIPYIGLEEHVKG